MLLFVEKESVGKQGMQIRRQLHLRRRHNLLQKATDTQELGARNVFKKINCAFYLSSVASHYKKQNFLQARSLGQVRFRKNYFISLTLTELNHGINCIWFIGDEDVAEA